MGYDPADFAPDEAGYEEWLEKQEKQSKCDHQNFMADVQVGRIQDGKDGPVTRYMADVRVECAECAVKMKFVGLPMGCDLNGASVNVDGTEARLAIFPENWPHPSNIKDEPPGFRIMNNSPLEGLRPSFEEIISAFSHVSVSQLPGLFAELILKCDSRDVFAKEVDDGKDGMDRFYERIRSAPGRMPS